MPNTQQSSCHYPGFMLILLGTIKHFKYIISLIHTCSNIQQQKSEHIAELFCEFNCVKTAQVITGRRMGLNRIELPARAVWQ